MKNPKKRFAFLLLLCLTAVIMLYSVPMIRDVLNQSKKQEHNLEPDAVAMMLDKQSRTVTFEMYQNNWKPPPVPDNLPPYLQAALRGFGRLSFDTGEKKGRIQQLKNAEEYSHEIVEYVLSVTVDHPVSTAHVDWIYDYDLVEVPNHFYKSKAKLIREALFNDHFRTRKIAVMTVTKAGDNKAIPRLRELLEDEDKRVQTAAAHSLGKLNDTESIERIMAELKEITPVENNDGPYSNPFHKEQAYIEALGDLQATVAIPLLTSILNNDDFDEQIRASTICALAQIGYKGAFKPALSAYFRASRMDVFQDTCSVWDSIWCMCDGDVCRYFETIKELGQKEDTCKAIYFLMHCPTDEAFSFIQETAKSVIPRERACAAWGACEFLDRDKARKIVCEVLYQGDWFDKTELVELAFKNAPEIVLDFLPNLYVPEKRNRTLSLLLAAKNKNTYSTLKKMLEEFNKTPDDTVYHYEMRESGNFEHDNAILEKSDYHFRLKLIETIAKLESPEFVPLLKEQLYQIILRTEKKYQELSETEKKKQWRYIASDSVFEDIALGLAIGSPMSAIKNLVPHIDCEWWYIFQKELCRIKSPEVIPYLLRLNQPECALEFNDVKIAINNLLDPDRAPIFYSIVLSKKHPGKEKAAEYLKSLQVNIPSAVQDMLTHEDPVTRKIGKELQKAWCDVPSVTDPPTIPVDNSSLIIKEAMMELPEEFRKLVKASIEREHQKRVDKQKSERDYLELAGAVLSGDTQTITDLQQDGASLSLSDYRILQFFIELVRKNKKEEIIALLDKGLDLTLSSHGDSTFISAFNEENLDLLDLLVKRGLDINSNYSIHGTMLHTLFFMESSPIKIIMEGEEIKSNNRLLIKKLIELGAYTTIKNRRGQSALDLAMSSGDKELIELAQKGAQNSTGEIPENPSGQALLEAITMCNVEAVNYILKSGTDPNEMVQYGQIKTLPLHQAFNSIAILAPIENSYAIIGLLLSYGADVNLQAGWTKGSALHVVIQNGDEKMFDLVMNAHPNVNLQDEEGNTPLHKCVDNLKAQYIQRLLDSGADTSIKNNEGLTPEQYAIDWNYKEAANILKKHNNE